MKRSELRQLIKETIVEENKRKHLIKEAKIGKDAGRIGMLNSDDTIDTIIVYNNANPEKVKPILKDKYILRSQMQKLLDFGNLIEFNGYSKDNVLAKGAKEFNLVTLKGMKSLLYNCKKKNIKHLYLFDLVNKNWIYIDVFNNSKENF